MKKKNFIVFSIWIFTTIILAILFSFISLEGKYIKLIGVFISSFFMHLLDFD